MHIETKKIEYSDGKKGVLSISPDIELENSIASWVKTKMFIEYEDPKYKMDRHTRKRNNLYSFKHPVSKTEVILKVSKIDKQYKFLRRTNLRITTFFSDYNFRAFKGGLLLKSIGVSCPNPLAYWTESGFLHKKKSYYLYEKVQASHSLFSYSQELLIENNNKELFVQLAKKATDIIRHIHGAGFRQGDPHPGNFLVSSTTQDLKSLNPDIIRQMDMSIIDLDKFTISKSIGRTIKRFFDLRCMRRCTLGPFDQFDMLKMYLRDEYSKTWKYVLIFWIHGGFNPFKWFRKPKRGQ